MLRTIQRTKHLKQGLLNKTIKNSKIGSISKLKNEFGNLNIQQINESDSIVKQALRDSLSTETNPRMQTVYNEEYYQLIKQKREMYATPTIEAHSQYIEDKINHPQSHKASAESKIFVEEVSGLKGGIVSLKMGYQGMFQPDQYRFADRVDYMPQVVENSVYTKIHNLSAIEMFEEEDLFENVYEEDDHFQKFVQFEEIEYAEKLMDNQILLTNILPRTTLQEIEARLASFKISPDSIKGNYNNFGNLINVVLTYNPSQIDQLEKIIYKIGGFNFHNSRVQVITNKDSEEENIINRRIVITGIPQSMSTDDILRNLSELPGFVSAEVPFRYENPNLPSTQQLQSILKNKFSDIGDREATQVYINEHDGNVVNQIRLDKDFNIINKKMIRGNEFDQNSILLEKYSYNLDSIPKPKIQDFIEQSSEAQSSNDRVIEIVDKKFFNSTKHAYEEREPLNTREINRLLEESESNQEESQINLDLTKKKIHNPDILSQEGDKHLGYMFVTYSSCYEAKKAMYAVKNNFNFYTVENEEILNAQLKLDTTHMDYDMEYRNRIYKAMKIREYLNQQEFQKELEYASLNQKIQQRKRELIEKITQGNTTEGSLEKDFYKVVEGVYTQRDNFQLSDDNLSVSQKIRNAETAKKLRNKFTLRNKLNKLFELEAKRKFLNNSSYYELNLPESDYEQKTALGRNYQKNSYEMNQNFLNRLLQRNRSENVGLSGLRIDPDIAELVDSINEYSQSEIDEQLKHLVEDYAEESNFGSISQRLAQYSQQTRNRLSLKPNTISADSLIDSALKEHQNDKELEMERQNQVRMINNQGKEIETKRSKKKAKVVRGFSYTPSSISVFKKINAQFGSKQGTSYEDQKKRFFNKMTNYAQGNFDQLGLLGPMKRYTQLASQGEHELKQYSVIRDINGDQFISEEDLNQIKEEISSFEYENKYLSSQVLLVRDEENHHKFRDGGRRIVREREENPYVSIIRKEAGQVESFYTPSSEDHGKSLQEIVDRLNKDLVNEEYQIYEDNGKIYSEPKIIKVILPDRVVNAERLLRFLKQDAVRFYKAALEAQNISISQIQKAVRRLSIRQLLRKTQELLTVEAYSEELFEIMSAKLAPQEIEIIINLQVEDENKILNDIENWKELNRAKEVVKPISDEDLAIYHKSSMRSLNENGRMGKDEFMSLF